MLEVLRHGLASQNVFGVLTAVEPNRYFIFGGEVILGLVTVVDERTADVSSASILMIDKWNAHVVWVKFGAGCIGAWITLSVLLGECASGVRVENVGVP